LSRPLFSPSRDSSSASRGLFLRLRSTSFCSYGPWPDSVTEENRLIPYFIMPFADLWSESGELVCIVASAQESNEGVIEDGIKDAFVDHCEIHGNVKTGLWDGDCFIYTSSVHRTMHLLGYIPKDNWLYLCDKELNIVSYFLLVYVLEYQIAVMWKDFSMADKVLPTVAKEQRTRVHGIWKNKVYEWC
uniref:Uncharacterized protein n=1 Tax=Erpetoichthys calabaricus TaxID=27687 RepID=A0A8C4RVE5_ERPCA